MLNKQIGWWCVVNPYSTNTNPEPRFASLEHHTWLTSESKVVEKSESHRGCKPVFIEINETDTTVTIPTNV